MTTSVLINMCFALRQSAYGGIAVLVMMVVFNHIFFLRCGIKQLTLLQDT